MDTVTERLADPRRLKRLQIRRILDSPQEEAFDRLTRLAARTLHAPVSLITFVDEGRQWFKSSYGLREPWASRRETPLSHSFCQYVVAYEQPLVIEDARADPLVQENLAIPEIGVVAYLGAPLVDKDGMVIGSFALIDEKPRRWTADEVEIVKDFAAVSATEVELRTEIAHRDEAEAALRHAQKMEAVGRLAGGVAHDFNNLLTVIQGNVQLLMLDLPREDPLRQDVEQIREAADSAAALSRQLLALSRKQRVQPRVIDLNEVLRATEATLRPLLREGVELVMHLDPGLGRIRFDQGRLEQVLVNLAINAADAMPRGGRLILETRNIELDDDVPVVHARTVQAGRYVLLAVSDTGRGVPSELQERIFEPFFSTREDGKGAGLGLATVYGMIRQSGGHISVQSETDRGTTFRIYLPRFEQPAQAPREGSSSPVVGRHAETVLLVEDQAGVRTLARRVLERGGLTVLEAAGPSEALRTVEEYEGQIDLLLTDVVMPGMDGPALAECIAVRRPGIRVLFMSGYPDDAVAPHGVLEPDVAYLEKPFDPETLLRSVEAVLEADPPAPALLPPSAD
jgi:two-component system, cell cycle sensor histidine kinase and response regulator CckA